MDDPFAPTPDDKVVTTNLATVKEGIRLRLRTAGGAIGAETAAQP